MERAREATGLAVPLARSGVADGPHDFEARLEPVLPRLKRLRALVPERHDLVLMKLLRCDEHDLQAIEELHHRSPLDPATLVTRYREEMDSAIIDPRRLRAQLLVAIERLFPDQVDAIARRLQSPEGRGGR